MIGISFVTASSFSVRQEFFLPGCGNISMTSNMLMTNENQTNFQNFLISKTYIILMIQEKLSIAEGNVHVGKYGDHLFVR